MLAVELNENWLFVVLVIALFVMFAANPPVALVYNEQFRLLRVAMVTLK